MLFHIILRELRYNILSLRLHLALLLTVLVFGFGTVAFVKNYKTANTDYSSDAAKNTENMRNSAEDNLSKYATQRLTHILNPRSSSFICDSREKYFPNSYSYNAYNVFGFSVRSGSANPYLQTFQELNWTFIVAIIICFTVFLFTFDSISGEKASRTLAVTFSYSLSRGTALFGKYLSAILTTQLVLIPGICLSLIIMLISGSLIITSTTILELIGFIAVATMFIACIAAFGMLASVITKSANVSLLIALAIWLVFVAIVPNTAMFWAHTLFPIESPEAVSERVSQARQAINDSAPPGSWSSNTSEPFFPRHELRAANQTNLMNSEKRIKDAYYLTMFRQLERARLVTLISPVSLFEYMSEAVVGGGYLRFRKNYDDLHTFQDRFLTYFKDKDAADDESPHWYNPVEYYSTTRKPVSFEEVPRYTESSIGFDERFSALALYLVIIFMYTAAVFSATYALFVRYDVR